VIVFFCLFSIIVWYLEVLTLFNNLKLALQSFKRNWQDYLAISFVFSAILFIGVLLGHFVVGTLLAYIIIFIPAIISLKFCAFHSYDKPQVEYRSLKIGFITFFKSIKIYFIVILKPILISLLIGGLLYSSFLSSAINISSETIPNLMESLSNYDTFAYTYEEMLQINEVKNLLNIGLIASLIVGYLIYFSLKLKRDFIPFIAFEMPITSKRAIAMNQRVLKGNYFKFFISNLLVVLLFVLPIGITYLAKESLASNEVFSQTTITLISSLVFCVLAGPIALIKQLHYIYSYKEYSKPYKEDFDNELKNVIKEIEEFIDKNEEK